MWLKHRSGSWELTHDFSRVLRTESRLLPNRCSFLLKSHFSWCVSLVCHLYFGSPVGGLIFTGRHLDHRWNRLDKDSLTLEWLIIHHKFPVIIQKGHLGLPLVIMACFAVIILSGFISISAAKEACDLYGAVGESLTLPLPLEFMRVANTDGLRWLHNGKPLFIRLEGRQTVGKPRDVSADGNLQLKNLQVSNAGFYEAKVQHLTGALVKAWSGHLCVMDKVSKPQLTYVCDFESSTINLNCDVTEPQGLNFSWMLNEKSTRETGQTWHVSLKEQRSFTCRVANRVSMERSDTVRPTCTRPASSSPTDLLCFPPKTVVAAIAGGVSVILLLIAIIIVLCFYYRCNKTQKVLRENAAVRMLSVNKREQDYETMNPTKNPRPPSPEPSWRASYVNVPPPEAQTGNGPLQLSTAAERQQPSPVPKPRTKITNIGMSLPQETVSGKENNTFVA